MKNNHKKLINEIQKIRSKNNVNWMDLLRLSFELDPRRSSKIMKKINNNDKNISKLLNKLSKVQINKK
ncbi:hypothetical protein N9374_03245 [Candidatus Pelagibacter sp.]|nr:hypothetical protein [Candidatus Pelagibacter sp.]